MKKISTLLMALAMLWMLTGLGSIALAEGYDYFDLDYSLDPTSLPKGGGTVDITIKIDHASNSAYVMSGTQVYKGNELILTLGNIYAGQLASKTATITVPSSEINNYNLTLRWKENNVTERTMNFKVAFTTTNLKPKVEFTRVASQMSGEPHDVVVLNYILKNTGKLHISDVKISDSVTGDIDSMPLLKAGQNFTASYSRSIDSGFVSQPKLSYKVGSTPYIVELDAMEILSGQPAIELETEVNKDVAAPGEEVVISCTVTNTGTADFTSLAITEKQLGEVFTADGLKAGVSKVFTKKLNVEEAMALEFTAAGGNGTEQEWVDVSEVNIEVDEKHAPLKVEVDASSNTLQLASPGMVDFEITLTNNGLKTLKDLELKDQDGNTVCLIDKLTTGRSTIQWSATVDQTTVYTFSLLVPVEGGETRQISSSPIEIKIVNPTTIEGAATPQTTPQPAANEDGSSNILKNTGLGNIVLIMGIVIGIVVVIAVVLASLLARESKKRKR